MPPTETTSVHEPLSQSLARVLAGDVAAAPLTANQLIEHTGGRGYYLVFVLLSLPFVAWVSVPGMSTVLGPVIGLLALRLALGKKPRLPVKLGDRELPPKVRRAMLGGGLKFLRFLEKGVRPRRTAWMTWPIARLANALLVVCMACLLMLPLPSPPFLGSNAFPSYAIILLALSMMEEDGAMIWVGYGASVVAGGYFVLLGGLIVKHLEAWFQLLLRLLERTR
ncbi:MAG: exopolysaccharide biosynthesis protein [Verrucomicrobia bacterium]|jgi:hypothetical protein|nr:exopolysaccharide biosynthesis protein [Verrucomicrobiota bacterium]